MAKLKGKKVLITGAAQGIGYYTAENFAKAGCELFLSDINSEALQNAEKRLSSSGVSIHTYILDIAQKDMVDSMAKDIIENYGGIDILINNAGIGYLGEIADTPLEKWKRLMDVNFWGALYHFYAFLPSMIERRGGHVVNVSSGQAFFRLPTWGVYAAIKTALGVFSEVSHFELKKYNIKVTTVYPFMVNTGFYDNVKADTFGAKLSMKLVPYYSQSPQKVGKIIFKAVKKGVRIETVHPLNEFGKLSQVLSPLGFTIGTVSNLFLGKGAKEYEQLVSKEKDNGKTE